MAILFLYIKYQNSNLNTRTTELESSANLNDILKDSCKNLFSCHKRFILTKKKLRLFEFSCSKQF